MGNKSTFSNRISEKVIDITLLNNFDMVRIFDRKVTSKCSFSDSKMILKSRIILGEVLILLEKRERRGSTKKNNVEIREIPRNNV